MCSYSVLTRNGTISAKILALRKPLWPTWTASICAGDTVDQNAITWLQIAHDKHDVVCGKVVHRHCRGLFEGNSRWEAKYAFRWCSDSLGVTRQLWERHDALADLERRPVTERA